jgi:hypothetical protein
MPFDILLIWLYENGHNLQQVRNLEQIVQPNLLRFIVTT